ncbi:hypothetical protein ACFLS9_07910 [Bacteroidota bacterium]
MKCHKCHAEVVLCLEGELTFSPVPDFVDWLDEIYKYEILVEEVIRFSIGNNYD